MGIQEHSYISNQWRSEANCQWNPVTIFSRGFKTSLTLREFEPNQSFITVIMVFFSSHLEDAKTVMVPPFADSISEGDVRWDKGIHILFMK